MYLFVEIIIQRELNIRRTSVRGTGLIVTNSNCQFNLLCDFLVITAVYSGNETAGSLPSSYRITFSIEHTYSIYFTPVQ